MTKLLVIGALAWDRPIRISGPLAPGARLVGRTLDGRLGGRLGGGGANAAVALAKAGRAVALASVVAGDAAADAAFEDAEGAGVDLALVRRRPGETKTTLIFIDPAGERVVMGLDWEPKPLPELDPPARWPDLRPAGLFVRSAYPGAAAWAGACQGPVVLHWPAPGYEGRADVVVASADDLSAEVLADPLAAARADLGEGVCHVVVTRGAHGAEAYGRDGIVRTPAPPAAVVDATGAGDIFAAGLLDALSAGAPMEAALAHACAWGAAAVGLDSSAPLDAGPGAFRAFAA
ncbi:MAG: carbohydrate kinase family protein [Phenylobacterium sp.]|uniref:carbohydrate kinase family protein n=1 Tax=Phenylobacterium sp. TaxID=1871053 RepID=UPI00391B5ADB